MIRPTNEEARLPFQTTPLTIGGDEIEEYVIPEDKKAEVLQQLCPFDPVPSLDEERLDLHSGKRFRVGDFRVTREAGQNLLVSQFYEEGGGTVIDWMPPEAAED